ncbi:hypothetical protein F4774DRAFT_411628 [Daldinia eschscholtzii]|nr:hypothetical protein F4774DRAFT_411628 [Daldinia eschscholtzii]
MTTTLTPIAYKHPSQNLTCSSQAKEGSDGSPSEVGLEGAFVGLEVSPDLFGFPGAFNVLDYYTGDDPGGIFGGDVPDVRLERSGGENYGEVEDEWSGVPMPGQFPISNWLAGRLNDTRDGTHGDAGYGISTEQPLEAQLADINQYDLDFDPNMGSDFDLSSLNFNPSTGQAPPSAEGHSGLSTGTRSEKGSAEHPTGPEFVCVHIIGVTRGGIVAINAIGDSQKHETYAATYSRSTSRSGSSAPNAGRSSNDGAITCGGI